MIRLILAFVIFSVGCCCWFASSYWKMLAPLCHSIILGYCLRIKERKKINECIEIEFVLLFVIIIFFKCRIWAISFFCHFEKWYFWVIIGKSMYTLSEERKCVNQPTNKMYKWILVWKPLDVHKKHQVHLIVRSILWIQNVMDLPIMMTMKYTTRREKIIRNYNKYAACVCKQTVWLSRLSEASLHLRFIGFAIALYQ